MNGPATFSTWKPNRSFDSFKSNRASLDFCYNNQVPGGVVRIGKLVRGVLV